MLHFTRVALGLKWDGDRYIKGTHTLALDLFLQSRIPCRILMYMWRIKDFIDNWMIELHTPYTGEESHTSYIRNPNTTQIYYLHLILVNYISLCNSNCNSPDSFTEPVPLTRSISFLHHFYPCTIYTTSKMSFSGN